MNIVTKHHDSLTRLRDDFHNHLRFLRNIYNEVVKNWDGIAKDALNNAAALENAAI